MYREFTNPSGFVSFLVCPNKSESATVLRVLRAASTADGDASDGDASDGESISNRGARTPPAFKG